MATISALAARRYPLLRWWPLYGLGLLALTLIACDWLLPLPESWRTVLLLPLTGVICLLVLRWQGRSDALLASEGVDAKVKADPVLLGLLEQADPAGPGALPRPLTPRPPE